MMSLNLFNATHLPARETVRRLATRLVTCLGVTFFIVESPTEVETLIERVYSYYDAYNATRERRIKIQSIVGDLDIPSAPLPRQPTAGEVFELLAMAAVGSYYVDEASTSLRLTCFHSARFGLDDVMEEAEEDDAGDDACYRVLRLLALLALYQILEKRGSCWWYIGTALNIAKTRNLDRYDGKSGCLEDRSLDRKRLQMRKLWGTLVCLESWIGATLGKVPSTKIDLDERIEIRDPIFYCREDTDVSSWDPANGRSATRALQTAIVRVAVLMADIQRSIYPASSSIGNLTRTSEPIDLTPIRTHKALLNQWFQSLPPLLSLSNLLKDRATPPRSAQCSSLSFAERSGMLLGHCLHQSAIMLLTRRIFLSVVDDPQGGYAKLLWKGDNTYISSEKLEALEYASLSLIAANTTGQIMGLMVREGSLVSKCWMAIYPAFNASVLLLFHLHQRKLLSGESNEEQDADTIEITENIQNCLSALEFCAAGGDILSKWYLQVLAPFRQVLGEEIERDIRMKVESTKSCVNENEQQPSCVGKAYAIDQQTCSNPEAPQSNPPHLSPVLGSPITGAPLESSTQASHPSPGLVGQIDLHILSANPWAYTISKKFANDFPAILAPINTGTMNSSILSTNIYRILTVLLQGSFRPEDSPRYGTSDRRYSSPGSVPDITPLSSQESSSGSSSSTGTSSTGTSSTGTSSTGTSSTGTSSTGTSSTGTSRGGSVTTSRSSSFPTVSPSDSPNAFSTNTPSISRFVGPTTGEKRRPSKQSPSPQSQEQLGVQQKTRRKHSGDSKRVRLEPYNALGFSEQGKQPTPADIAALLRRAA